MPFKDPQLDLWNDFDKAGPQERPEAKNTQKHFEPVTPLEREVVDPLEDDADFEEARRQADRITAEQEMTESKGESKHQADLKDAREKIEKRQNWEREIEKKMTARRQSRKVKHEEGKGEMSRKVVFDQEARKRDEGKIVTDEDYRREVEKIYNEKDPMGDIYPAFGKRFR